LGERQGESANESSTTTMLTNSDVTFKPKQTNLGNGFLRCVRKRHLAAVVKHDLYYHRENRHDRRIRLSNNYFEECSLTVHVFKTISSELCLALNLLGVRQGNQVEKQQNALRVERLKTNVKVSIHVSWRTDPCEMFINDLLNFQNQQGSLIVCHKALNIA
jgi:hypothetical protein